MTHDSHATGSPRQPGRRPTRPDLGRPSLFADFDQESVEDVEPQRVRLLSTLESQRGARARPRGQRRGTSRTRPWLTRALMVVMGLGMLVMLLSFMQLLRRPSPSLPKPPAAAAHATAAAPLSPGQHQALPEHMAAVSEAAEIIEVEPPAGGLQPAMVASTPAAPRAQAVPPSPPKVATSEADRLAHTTTKATAARNTPVRRDSPASPDDVALVEAMLAHAGPRRAPQPPTEALKQCGTGTSPETSVCRARICVQHPSLAACHTP